MVVRSDGYQYRGKTKFGALRYVKRLTPATGVGILVSVFAVVSLIDVPRELALLSGAPIEWERLISTVAGCIAMGLAPWFPLSAVGVGLVPMTITLVIGRGYGAEAFVIVFCLIAVAVKSRRWHLWVLCGIYAAWCVGCVLRGLSADFGWVYGVIIFCAALIGLFIRHFVIERMADRRRLIALEAENAQIRSHEREQLARELHDVVAHQLSIITLQVTAYGDCDDSAKLRSALAKIDTVSRTALTELRTLVGVLRDTSDGNISIEPTALLTQANVQETAANIHATLIAEGYHPEMHVDINPDQLDASLTTTISRILTETSTNIMRYAPSGAACAFQVVSEPDYIRVQVTNPLGDSPATSWQSGGWGLRGLRERVHLIGGSFEAGPVNNNWVVTGTLRCPS